MEIPLSSIQSAVQKIKSEIFSIDIDLYSFVCPSAYDTAWLAIIPDSRYPSEPMFKNYLNWLLNNQKPEGFWGESDTFGKPTFESLPATLVSMVALKKWNRGKSMIEKGRSFIRAYADKLLNEVRDDFPRWFVIVLPAMVELADTIGLDVDFPEASRKTMSYICSCRESFLNKEEHEGGLRCYPPLLSHLEALPASYVSEEDICRHLSMDGSLFQSPSATAKAFMAFRNKECFTYLHSLKQRCPNGVPQAYPMDEDLIKLCMVNHLQRLGLGEYFVREIEEFLLQVYRNYKKSWAKSSNMSAAQLHKNSLAFQLLRMHGFKVSPSKFCWFLHHDEIKAQVEKDYDHFSGALLQVFRASNLMFCGEYELEEARTFSQKLLEKIVSAGNGDRQQIKYELSIPWFARLDLLDHRMWIEESEANALWKGKTSYNRISHLHNDQLLQLARENYEFKQLIYREELEELKRWSERWGLSSMGFGREKTTYCYFAIAAATSLPHDSYVRMLVAKSAIIITVADDFFDMEGSLTELEGLTDAVRRWDSRGLSSHSKVIFQALDNLVSEAYHQHVGIDNDITNSMRDLWYETFASWLMEAKWSRTGHTPSLDNYLITSMISVAAHTMVLPASCFLNVPNEKLRPTQYEAITKLLMVICRLLNDVQSYQKEKEEGKINCVLVNMVENPESNIEDSIALAGEIIDKKKKELLEHALIEGHSNLSKASNLLHLSCLKVYHMFFNSSNRYDSDTEMLQDISKAIYLPVSKNSKPLEVVPLQSMPKKINPTTPISYSNSCFKHCKRTSFTAHRVSQPDLRKGRAMVPLTHKVLNMWGPPTFATSTFGAPSTFRCQL